MWTGLQKPFFFYVELYRLGFFFCFVLFLGLGKGTEDCNRSDERKKKSALRRNLGWGYILGTNIEENRLVVRVVNAGQVKHFVEEYLWQNDFVANPLPLSKVHDTVLTQLSCSLASHRKR